MSNETTLHATLIALNGKGVLLTGKSGSGKSDLALKLIADKGAMLVADDVVVVEKKYGKIYGKAPQNISGKMEIRGIGIVEYPYLDSAEIVLEISLVDDITKIERLPEKRTDCILGLEIEQIDLYAKENSAPEKVLAAFERQMKERTKKC